MIKAIRFQNCQSFKDVTYNFAEDRLNVIASPNDTGKSIFFKVLKLAGKSDYYNRVDRKDLIRRGAPFAQVTFQFTDNSFGVMRIFEDKAIYAWVEELGGEISWYLDPPMEMVERLGLLVSDSESFVANVIDTEQGILLVDPKLTSNYELVRLIATCEDLDLIRERVEPLIREYSDLIVRERDSIGFLEKQLEATQYVDVESLEKKKIACEAAIEVADGLSKVYSVLERIEYPKENLNCEDLLKVAEVLEVLECIGVGRFPTIPKKIDDAPLEILSSLELVKEKVVKVRKQKEELPLSLANSLMILAQIEKSVKGLRMPESVKGEGLIEVLEVLEGVKVRAARLPDYKSVDNRVKELEEMFSRSGQEVECPLYGKVVFDGKECVADSE